LEIAEARRIVEAFETATQKGQASISLDGKMIDIPVAERAKRLLAKIDTIATMGK
jgi:citrate lyase subunit beta/citryl-CoA lyase